MIEKQTINDKEVWVEIDPYRVKRANPNIIPTEYFTAKYYLTQPETGNTHCECINDEDGKPKLFESPIEALDFARKKLESVL